MKSKPTKETASDKSKSKAQIETDMLLSEKDEVKRAEDKMRQSAKATKKA